MHLKAIASKWVNEPLEIWDEVALDFTGGVFDGRVSLTDRFLSNFNKPLRRRMLFTRPETELPSSLTFRHPGTQDVYILGQPRGDARKGVHYLNMTVCHLVTETPYGSSGLCQVYRKAPLGPPENPGWLVEQKMLDCFIDFEFRTSSNEEGMYEDKVENYFAYVARHHQLKEWDFIELHGNRYRVVDTFADSGLFSMRVDLEPDKRVDFVAEVETSKVYDNINHKWVEGESEFNVTGILTSDHSFSTWISESEPYIDVVFEAEHIGFVPTPDKVRLKIGGKTRVVTMVTKPPGSRQYTLRCK